MLQSLPFVPNVFPAVLGYGIETLYRVHVADNVTERPVARTFSAADGEPPVPNTCTPLMPNRGVPDAALAQNDRMQVLPLRRCTFSIDCWIKLYAVAPALPVKILYSVAVALSSPIPARSVSVRLPMPKLMLSSKTPVFHRSAVNRLSADHVPWPLCCMLNSPLRTTFLPTSLNAGATTALTCCSGVACSAVAALPDRVIGPVMVPPAIARKLLPVLAFTHTPGLACHCQVTPPEV